MLIAFWPLPLLTHLPPPAMLNSGNSPLLEHFHHLENKPHVLWLSPHPLAPKQPPIYVLTGMLVVPCFPTPHPNKTPLVLILSLTVLMRNYKLFCVKIFCAVRVVILKENLIATPLMKSFQRLSIANKINSGSQQPDPANCPDLPLSQLHRPQSLHLFSNLSLLQGHPCFPNRSF